MHWIREIIFLVLYLLGMRGIFLWRKPKREPTLFFFSSLWTFGLLFIYLMLLELKEQTFYLLIPLTFLSIFLASYFYDKRRLINGMLFNLFVLSFGGYLLLLFGQTGNIVLGGLIGLIAIPLILVTIFGIYALILFLYWNSIVVLRKETRSFANMLTLFLALLLTLFILSNLFLISALSSWAGMLFSVFPAILLYFFVLFLNYLSVSVLYQFNHPRYRQDYIIVLGAGLLNGDTVTPLLAKRINKAIAFYRAQERATLRPPHLLMSGGQGADEKIPEAIAMKNYALEKGIPKEQILVETNSTTTLENMLFSKEIMDQRSHSSYRAIFTSNNYHIFRAGMYARQANLKADGIGSKTAFYYLPNAFLREYIAILFLHKKRHLIVVGLLGIFGIMMSLFSLFVM
ncbi:MAG: YdcF family protein [Enterococcus sp.]